MKKLETIEERIEGTEKRFVEALFGGRVPVEGVCKKDWMLEVYLSIAYTLVLWLIMMILGLLTILGKFSPSSFMLGVYVLAVSGIFSAFLSLLKLWILHDES